MERGIIAKLLCRESPLNFKKYMILKDEIFTIQHIFSIRKRQMQHFENYKQNEWKTRICNMELAKTPLGRGKRGLGCLGRFLIIGAKFSTFLFKLQHLKNYYYFYNKNRC